MSDESYREAISQRGHRDRFARGLPVRVAFMPIRDAVSPRFARFFWRVGLTRDYLPAMATPDGRRWWTIAHWHRLQVGPLVVLWRTAIHQPDTDRAGGRG